jgi:formate dehydrogenase major subunit
MSVARWRTVRREAFELTSRRDTRDFFAALARGARGRLTKYMRYDAASNHYMAVGWEEAFVLIKDGRAERSLPSFGQADISR